LRKVQTVALCLIALVLMADFAVEHVLPVAALALKEQEYLDAARTCHEARSNWQQARDTADRYDRETSFAVNQSATVGLMDCYKKEYLHRSLLSWGVTENELNRLDLFARNESEVGLRYFVQGVTGEK